MLHIHKCVAYLNRFPSLDWLLLHQDYNICIYNQQCYTSHRLHLTLLISSLMTLTRKQYLNDQFICIVNQWIEYALTYSQQVIAIDSKKKTKICRYFLYFKHHFLSQVMFIYKLISGIWWSGSVENSET